MDILHVLLIIKILINSIAALNLSLKLISDNLVSNLLTNTKEENNDLNTRVKIKIYTGYSIDSSTTIDVPINETDMIYKNINNTRPLVIYIHGYREHSSNESVHTIIGAHLDRGTDNIFLVDWSDLAFEDYFNLLLKIRNMAKIIANTLDKLVHLGLDLERFHLVGHSMGAQMAGFIGKYSNYTLPRITGLDPAGPGFNLPTADHLNSENAKFVDILHTDMGLYGTVKIAGTVDFFANGGKRPQPGCALAGPSLSPADLCSHWRSWRIYAESIKNPNAFPAIRCLSYLMYLKGNCEKNEIIYFGYSTSIYARGSYFFTTNDKSPYGKASESF